jgi:hypothetical protein
MLPLIALVVIVSILGVILSRPPIARALLGLLRDRREQALFALFVLAEIAAVALVLAVLGPRVGLFLIVVSVALLVILTTQPPAKGR